MFNLALESILCLTCYKCTTYQRTKDASTFSFLCRNPTLNDKIATCTDAGYCYKSVVYIADINDPIITRGCANTNRSSDLKIKKNSFNWDVNVCDSRDLCNAAVNTFDERWFKPILIGKSNWLVFFFYFFFFLFLKFT